MDSRITFELDALGIQPMASGRLCLNLSERVTWESFPRYANDLLKFVSGKKVDAAESVEMRVWTIVMDGSEMRLVQEDFPSMVSLEAMDGGGDEALRRLHAKLLAAQSN